MSVPTGPNLPTLLLRIAAGLVLLAAGGCAVSQPVTVPLVAVGEEPRDAAILRRNVTATDCPEFLHMYGDYSRAVAAALAGVPEANALVNVRFAIRDTLGHYCMRVTGDAARLP